jgi:dipeptidyl aminopeptidase/acylaminoacyl peptidase
LVAGVEWLVKQDRVDPSRIGIAAHSYGGGLAAFATEQSSLFRAVSIHEGNFLLMGAPESYTAEAWQIENLKDHGFGSPIERSERQPFLLDSPAEFADRMKAPSLLIYGAQSYAPTQGREFFAVLQYFKVPSEFIVLPRTGHNTREPKLIEDSYRRNLEWFDYWLKGVATDRMRERYGPHDGKEGGHYTHLMPACGTGITRKLQCSNSDESK